MRVEKCFSCGKEFKVEDYKDKFCRVRHYKDLYCKKCRKPELRKSYYAMKENDNEDCWQGLREGVMERAGKDYAKAIKKWHNAYTDTGKKEAFQDLIIFSRWWKSEDFMFWAGELNGIYIQRSLNTKIFKTIKKITNMNAGEKNAG